MKCPERNNQDGTDDRCCLHDLLDDHIDAPGRVCCWCGNIWQPDYELNAEHGQYKPSPHWNITKGKIKRFKGILR